MEIDLIDELKSNKPCPQCGKKMIKWPTGLRLLVNPPLDCWNWKCGCGHEEKGGSRSGLTEAQNFRIEWEKAQE